MIVCEEKIVLSLVQNFKNSPKRQFRQKSSFIKYKLTTVNNYNNN